MKQLFRLLLILVATVGLSVGLAGFVKPSQTQALLVNGLSGVRVQPTSNCGPATSRIQSISAVGYQVLWSKDYMTRDPDLWSDCASIHGVGTAQPYAWWICQDNLYPASGGLPQTMSYCADSLQYNRAVNYTFSKSDGTPLANGSTVNVGDFVKIVKYSSASSGSFQAGGTSGNLHTAIDPWYGRVDGTGQLLPDFLVTDNGMTVSGSSEWSIVTNSDGSVTATALAGAAGHASTLQIVDNGGSAQARWNGCLIVPYFYQGQGYSCPYYQNVFKPFTLPGVTLTNFNFSVAAVPVNRPPATPTVDCTASVIVGNNATVGYVTTDPDNDTLKYLVAFNYTGAQVSDLTDPSSGYVSGGLRRTTTKSWASTGTKTVGVWAMDSKGATSAVGTCSIVVNSAPPPLTNDLQLQSQSGSYTDAAVTYDFPLAGWGSGGAGVTVPSHFSATYASCMVVNTTPNAAYQINWDTHTTVSTAPTSGYQTTTPALIIKGTGTTPSAGASITFTVMLGCSSTRSRTDAGLYDGTPDTQQVTLSFSGTAPSSLNMTINGKHGTATDPVVIDTLAPTGVASTSFIAAWDSLAASGSAFRGCVATRDDALGTMAPTWNSTGRGVASTQTEAVTATFTADQVASPYLTKFTVTCNNISILDPLADFSPHALIVTLDPRGSVSDEVYVQFKRQSAGNYITVNGYVYNDADSSGSHQSGETGQASQEVTLHRQDGTGATYSTTTGYDGSYSFTFMPDTASAAYEIWDKGGLPTSDWSYTQPSDKTGKYSNLVLNKGDVVSGKDFGMKFSSSGGTATIKVHVYTDLHADGTEGPEDTPISGQEVQAEVPVITNVGGVLTVTTVVYGCGPTLTPCVTDALGNVDIKVPVSGSVIATMREINPPANTTLTESPSPLTLTPGATKSATFGNAPPQDKPGTVSGVVFGDDGSGMHASNGILDADEKGIAGQKVSIIDVESGKEIAGRVTSADPATLGYYSMTVPVEYLGKSLYIKVSYKTAGYVFTIPLSGSYTRTFTSGLSLSNQNFGEIYGQNPHGNGDVLNHASGSRRW